MCCSNNIPPPLFLDIKRKMQQYFDMAVVNIYFTTMVVAAIIVNDQITHLKILINYLLKFKVPIYSIASFNINELTAD